MEYFHELFPLAGVLSILFLNTFDSSSAEVLFCFFKTEI